MACTDDPARADPEVSPDSEEQAFLAELRRAQRKFVHGYVGVNLFLPRWESGLLDPSEERRRAVLDGLVASDGVEIYDTDDGTKALRIRKVEEPGPGA